jgi:hypothetical protein
MSADGQLPMSIDSESRMPIVDELSHSTDIGGITCPTRH